jgi:hypothetical protein
VNEKEDEIAHPFILADAEWAIFRPDFQFATDRSFKWTRTRYFNELWIRRPSETCVQRQLHFPVVLPQN